MKRYMQIGTTTGKIHKIELDEEPQIIDGELVVKGVFNERQVGHTTIHLPLCNVTHYWIK